MNKKIVTIFMTAIVILAMNPASEGAWIETQNYGLGTISFPGGSPWGQFIYIPECPYLIFRAVASSSSLYSMITIDVRTGKLRDGLSSEIDYYKSDLIPDAESGWNLFFSSDGKFGKLHINSHGEFGDVKWFARSIEGVVNKVGVSERKEIWYFSNRITRLKTETEEWTEYPYPDNWNNDFEWVYLYPSENLDTLIARTEIISTEEYQAMWFDLRTGESKMIESEANFFDDVKDISSWNGYPGKYLMLKRQEVWSYDSNTGEITLLIEGLRGSTREIMQSQSGHELYTLGEGNTLFIIDLIEKKTSVNLIPLHKDDFFTGNSYFDSDRSKIISIIGNMKTGDSSLMILDLNDNSVKYISGLPDFIALEAAFIKRQNKVFVTSTPYIYFVDLDTNKVSKSTSLYSKSNTWSAIKGEDSPVLLPDAYLPFFKNLGPLGGKELYSTGTEDKLKDALMYPGYNIAFLQTGVSNYREYYFDDNSTYDYELSGYISWNFADPHNKQIISFMSYDSDTVFFIKPRGNVRSWSPDETNNLQSINCIFDPDHDSFWTVFVNTQTSDYNFYQISTKDQTTLDWFTIDPSELRHKTIITPDRKPNYTTETAEDDLRYNFKISNDGKYFYFIDVVNVNNGKDRYLIVFDIEQRKAVKEFKLQEHVVDKLISYRVYPQIITIPGHDRLFIWLHDRAFCIDTNTWELIYGDIQVEPQAFRTTNVSIEGFWDEERQRVIIFDFCYEGKYDGMNIFQVDLETGDILKEEKFPIGQVTRFFPAPDKKKVYMLSSKSPVYYVVNLDPAWEFPATVSPETNFLDYTPGDNCRMTINVANGERARSVKLYIWLRLPGGACLFYNGKTFVPEVVGISGYLPARIISFRIDLVNFTIPEIMPEGFYNLNALFMNDKYEFGPMGTWNFYVGK